MVPESPAHLNSVIRSGWQQILVCAAAWFFSALFPPGAALAGQSQPRDPHDLNVLTLRWERNHISRDEMVAAASRLDTFEPASPSIPDGVSGGGRLFYLAGRSDTDLHLKVSHGFLHAEALVFAQTGDRVFDGQRCRSIRQVCFVVPRDSQGLLVFVTGTMMNLHPAALRAEESYWAQSNQVLYDGIYYGIVIVMLLYNLALFLGSRDRSSAFFCLYILSNGGAQLCLSGDGPALGLWTQGLQDFLIVFFVNGLMIPSILQLTRTLLGSVSFRFRNALLHGLTALSLMNPIFYWLFPNAFCVQYMNAVLLFSVLLVILSVLWGSLKRDRESVNFLLSFTPISAAATCITAANLGFIVPHPALDAAVQLSFGAQITILSLVLARKLQSLRQQIAESEVRFEQEKKDQLKARLRLLGVMAVHLADRINTPLQTISVSAAVLSRLSRRGDIGPETAHTLTKVSGGLTSSVTAARQELQKIIRFRDFAPDSSLEMDLEVEMVHLSLHTEKDAS